MNKAPLHGLEWNHYFFERPLRQQAWEWESRRAGKTCRDKKKREIKKQSSRTKREGHWERVLQQVGLMSKSSVFVCVRLLWPRSGEKCAPLPCMCMFMCVCFFLLCVCKLICVLSRSSVETDNVVYLLSSCLDEAIRRSAFARVCGNVWACTFVFVCVCVHKRMCMRVVEQ